MIQVKNIITILFLLFVITSCIEKYWPEVDKYEGVVVVDGLLTNGDEPVVVRLSVSSSFNSGELIPVSGGDLYVIDEEQVETILIETDTGIYKVFDPSFKATIGSSYQLHILLPNGSRFESEICQLTEPSPIDSVYWVVETQELLNYNHLIQGIQFYIDNHSDNSDTCYYLWRLSQTFKYRSSFNLDYTWEGALIPFPNPDSLRTCWHTNSIGGIFTFSTKDLNNPVIRRFPLNYVSTESRTLSIRYSLLVKQLSITEKAYEYWNELGEQISSQGNMYSQQPVQIRGNVYNVNDSEELVLGYFTVAGVSEKRIYVDRPGLTFYYDVCEPDYNALLYIQYEAS